MTRFLLKNVILLGVLGFIQFFSVLKAEGLIYGRVELEGSCQGKAMVWLSHKTKDSENELLLHTLVPHSGSFAFSVSPDLYEIWASSEQGCESTFSDVEMKKGQNLELNIRLKK